MSDSGAAMFARFAFPPNELGYCGPDDHRTLYAYGATGDRSVGDVLHLARAFEGAWPYLELLNDAAAINDPLAEAVVEAYWIGGDLLGRIDTARWGRHLVDRFRPRTTSAIDHITYGVGRGAVPNHAFHVFGVYPWVGLLRAGRGGGEPARILDRCRVRWGTVQAVAGDSALVLARPVTWDGRALAFGCPQVETVRIGRDGLELAGPISRGDHVAMHWDWICQRLDGRQLRNVMRVNVSQLQVANLALQTA